MARYWIRERASESFQGPYTLVEIAELFQREELFDQYDLLEASGQSHGALKRETGWRSLREFDLSKFRTVNTPLELLVGHISQHRYGLLEALAYCYKFAAGLTAIATLIGCLIGSSFIAPRSGGLGLSIILFCLVSGVITVITLLAFAEGIKLAINVATDIRDIRDCMTQNNRDDAS